MKATAEAPDIGRTHGVRSGATEAPRNPAGGLVWRAWLERLLAHERAANLARITAGYNPFDLAWELKPGSPIETPPFYAGYTSIGQGEASRILQRFQLAAIPPAKPDPRPRPIIYNSWEATEFAVDEPGQTALAD